MPNYAYPDHLITREQWLLWKPESGGRKVPRAPWVTGDPFKFVSATDQSNWTSFETALEWKRKLPGDFELAYVLSESDDTVFIDLDNVVSDAGISDAAADVIQQTDSYTAVSTSGSGLHILGTGELPASCTSITGVLNATCDGNNETVEVYDSDRFIALTGDHVETTPATLSDASSTIERFTAQYESDADSTSQTPRMASRQSSVAPRPPESDSTDNVEDIFAAIEHTTPSEITLVSEKTNSRGDGSASYDPAWAESDSGTRLAVLEDGWIYRKGMIELDALQVVALEEGLITSVDEYPRGEAFWESVDRLRDRGAAIPTYRNESASQSSSTRSQPAD